VEQKTDGTPEGMVFSAYRYMIEHVIASASTELSREACWISAPLRLC
jgi:hypothetical protein